MRIGREAAGRAFDSAFELAASREPLPEEWLSRFQKLVAERTYSAVLATALLARAVEPRADAFVLQAKSGSKGYSARGLFTQIIFEKANLRGVPLGSIGREPHNNQPFYGHSRIQDIDRGRLRRFALLRFDELLASLKAANQLDENQALRAFAAFLRVRLQEPVIPAPPLDLPLLDMLAVMSEIRRLVRQGGESGRRGEAVAAAAMDLVFSNVHLNAKANDPSRHWPGDVVVLASGSTIRSAASADVIMTVEVKERTATEGEILQFASNLATYGLHRGIYVALAGAQPDLLVERLQEEIWKRHQVVLLIVVGTDALLRLTVTLTQLPMAAALTRLAIRLTERLKEKESSTGSAEWSSFLKRLGPSAGGVVPLLRPESN